MSEGKRIYARGTPVTAEDDTASCDCCGEMVPISDIAKVIAYGIETFACGRCRGVEPDEG